MCTSPAAASRCGAGDIRGYLTEGSSDVPRGLSAFLTSGGLPHRSRSLGDRDDLLLRTASFPPRRESKHEEETRKTASILAAASKGLSKLLKGGDGGA